MLAEELKPNVTVSGPLFPEPIQVIDALPMGASVKLVGKGTRSNTVYEPILTAVVNDGTGKDQRFWKLAQALSALYPPATNEKRWVDGVLARKKGLGL